MRRWLPILLLLFPWPASATITFVTDGKAGSGTTDANISLTATAGDLIWVFINSNSTAGTLSINTGVNSGKDSLGNSYTAAFAQFSDSGSNVIVRGWTTVVTTGGADTIDCHNTNSANWMGCVALTFHSTAGWPASPVDVTASNSMAATTSMAGGTTANTAQANEVILGSFGVLHVVGNTYTAGGSYTYSTNGQELFSGVDTMVEYQIVAAQNPYQATGSATSAVSGAGWTVALKDSSGGGGGATPAGYKLKKLQKLDAAWLFSHLGLPAFASLN